MVGKRRETDVLFGFESIKLIHQLCHRSWAQDDVAACATWLYKGFPLSPAASLPPKLELKEDRNLRQEWISRELMKLVQSWYHSHHQLNIVFIYIRVRVQIEFSYCLGSCFKTYKLQSRFKQMRYEMMNYCHALHASWQPAVFRSQRFSIHHSVSCVSAECRCFHGEIGSIGTSMTRISNDWTLGSRWRCYQHNPIDSCHIKAKHPLMSMFLWRN